jgi:putative FmdB family regulatory protein
MPTYEYDCDSCGNGFEVMQKMSDAPVDSCPECGKKVRRVLSGGIGISFKGSGFYVNDATKNSTKPATASASAPSTASSGD